MSARTRLGARLGERLGERLGALRYLPTLFREIAAASPRLLAAVLDRADLSPR